jgi:hypothetical protein
MMAETKNRHGCLLAWLILIIIANSMTALSYLVYTLGRDMIMQTFRSFASQSQLYQSQLLQVQILLGVPVWVFIVLIAFSIFNVVCAIALLLWKKWGFWGYCASSAAVLALNLLYVSRETWQIIYSAVGGLLWVLLLFAVLHIGRENKGWPQLN